MNIGPHLLGRTLEHDPRSRSYEHPTRKLATAAKRNVAHTLNAPTLNQGEIGSCEGNTAAEWLNTAAALKNRKAYNAKASRHANWYLDEVEAVYLYSTATKLDEDGIASQYPPDDSGTSGVGIAKAMQQLGGIARYNWTFTFEAALAALQTQPIMFGTNWYQSMLEVDNNGYVIPPQPGDEPAGGHAYAGIVLDWTHSRVGCTNHWTDQWGTKIAGHHGRFWITFDLLEQLLIHEQGDSLVPVIL